MIRLAVAFAAIASFASVARAGETAAGRAFREASERAVAGDAGAIDAFEALGAMRPTSRWTDDAWAEAARLAERARDYARARRDLEHLIALGAAADPRLIDNAHASARRIEAMTGAGTWDGVVREHERLFDQVHGGSDPREALEALEALVRANPGYPRATIARLAIARGWEAEGHPARGLEWYRSALANAEVADRQRTGLALARALIRQDDLEPSRRVLATIAAQPDADQAAIAEVREKLAVAVSRSWIRTGMWIVLAAIVLLAIAMLRRDAGSWRSAARMLLPPPSEVLFLAPIALVLIVLAHTGNPIVADSVTGIIVGGVAIAWISGALLEAARRRRQRLHARRAVIQAAVAVAAAGAVAYIAVEHFRVIDLVVETWDHGPVAR